MPDDLKLLAQNLQSLGTKGDTVLAHINPVEAALLKMLGGSGDIEPATGLVKFDTEAPGGRSGPGSGGGRGVAGGGGNGGTGGGGSQGRGGTQGEVGSGSGSASAPSTGDFGDTAMEPDFVGLPGQFQTTTREANAFEKFFGIETVKTRRDFTPTGDLETLGTSVEGSFSPLGFLAGLVGGIPGALAAKAVTSLTDLKDPFSIDFNTGFVKGSTTDPNGRGDRGDSRAQERVRVAKAIESTGITDANSELDALVADVLQKEFTAFSQPTFTRLSNDFGLGVDFNPFNNQV